MGILDQQDLENFLALPLTKRMKAAATVLEDASRQRWRNVKEETVSVTGWTPAGLREVANDWEAEEKNEDQVTELAKVLFEDLRNSDLGNRDFADLTPQQRIRWKQTALTVMEMGWTKP